MAQIKSEQMYQALLNRIDELLKMTSDNDSMDDPRMLELEIISDLIVEYEDIHYPIGKPSLVDIIKLRMYEMGLTQQAVAAMLGISAPRMSEIMHGKTEPSLSLARAMSQKLNIDANVILGV